MLEIATIETPTLGDRSYLVHDGHDAFVVDPQRDIDRILDLAAAAGVVIRHVFETHIHSDYVTGGRALANATGGVYYVNSEDPVTFDRHPIADGDAIQVAPTLTVKVLATPGHTFTHLSYALLDAGHPVAVFTGGSLLFGSTGRPDLLGSEATDPLAHAQWRSAHRLAAELPDDAAVLPTHGFGSFCSATQNDVNASTVAQEKKSNPALIADEDSFVRDLLAELDAYPAYYAHISPTNLAAPAHAPDLGPPQHADPDELSRRIDAGEWVVDLRSRTAFAAEHLHGTFSVGLDGSFATYLGWVIPWDTPLTLLGETAEQVSEAQRELVRIGIDRLAGAATGGPREWTGDSSTSTMRVATFAELEPARADHDVVVLDVRRTLEWNESHVAGAVHVTLHELLGRIADVPDGELWVHCATGYRAAIAASMLAAAGREVVLVNDDYDKAADSTQLVTECSPPRGQAGPSAGAN